MATMQPNFLHHPVHVKLIHQTEPGRKHSKSPKVKGREDRKKKIPYERQSTQKLQMLLMNKVARLENLQQQG